MNINIVCNQNY